MSGITRNGVFIYLKNFESLEGGMDTSPSPESIAQREKEAIEAIVNGAKPMYVFRKVDLHHKDTIFLKSAGRFDFVPWDDFYSNFDLPMGRFHIVD